MTAGGKIRLPLALLIMLALLAVCAANGGTSPPDGLYDLPVDDALAVREFVIGNSVGVAKAVVENGETSYRIYITLPADTEFKNCVANITLSAGAILSGDSPGIANDLSGRPVLNLTRENRSLIVTNNGESREYTFEIALSGP